MKTIIEQIRERVINDYNEYDINDDVNHNNINIDFTNEINECTKLSEILEVLGDYGFGFRDGFDFIDNCISK